MFGGFGLYKGKVIFGAIIENHLYFRVDETNKSDYEAYQSQPFIFEGQKKPVRMPYMTLPDEIFENQVLLKVWIQKALEASLRHKLKKANKKKMIK